MVKNKPKRSLANSNFIALILLTIVNASMIALLLIVGNLVDIQPRYFLIAICSIAGITLLVNIIYILAHIKKIRWMRKVFLIFTSLVMIIGLVGTYYSYRGKSFLDQIINTTGVDSVEYSIITLDETNTLETIGAQNVGYVSGDETYQTTLMDTLHEYSRTVQMISYENLSVLDALLEDEVTYAVVPKDFKSLYNQDSENAERINNAIVLYTFSTEVTAEVSDVDVVNEPFSVLVLGNNEGLSDSIIVMTFNPKTLKLTMTSLARDSYVPIACYSGNAKDKLNHARAQGVDCIMNTVEDLLDIDIDFYFETDFYALIKIVDALGGIEIESPITFYGSVPDEDGLGGFTVVRIDEGLTLMTGAEALTFARERHHFPDGDFARQRNQQYVIKQIASKILATRNVNTLLNVLGAAKDNMQTNLPLSHLSSLMGYALQNAEYSPTDMMGTFRIVQSQVTGTTPVIDGMSVVVPDSYLLALAKRIIKNNLETETVLTDTTAFSFSYQEPYETEFPDPEASDYSNTSGGSTEPVTDDEEPAATPTGGAFVIPDFNTMSETAISEWGTQNGVTLNIRIIDSTSSSYQSYYADGQVIYQSTDPGTYTSKITYLDISIVRKDEEPAVNQEQTVPDFTGWTVSAIRTWSSEYGVNVEFTPASNISDTMKATGQSVASGTSLQAVASTIVITIAE